MSSSRNLQPTAMGIADLNARVCSHALLLNAFGFEVEDTA